LSPRGIPRVEDARTLTVGSDDSPDSVPAFSLVVEYSYMSSSSVPLMSGWQTRKRRTMEKMAKVVVSRQQIIEDLIVYKD